MVDESAGAIAKFDVISFAKNILNEVGKIRSFRETTDSTTGKGFVVSAESNINAFFRLVGLPMLVTFKKKDKTKTSSGDLKEGDHYLTPGYSQTFSRKLSEYDIDNSKDVKKNLEGRESKLLENENNVGTNDMNNAMTGAILWPIPLLANIPQETNKSEAEMIASAKDLKSVYKRDVFKKLKPLMTTYIKDGIKPFRNELARPFLRDPKEQLIDSETILTKPFIETVVRTRLVSCDGSGAAWAAASSSAAATMAGPTAAGSAAASAAAMEAASGGSTQQNNENFLNSLKQYLNEEELNEIFKSNIEFFKNGDLLERFVVYRLIDSLTQLAKEWVEIQNIQERLFLETRFNIVIKTTSSKQSPFGKRTEITADAMMTEQSDLGIKLQNLRQKEVKQEALLSLLPTEDVVTDDKNLKIKNTQNVALAALVTPFVSLASNSLIQTRKQISELNNELIKKGQEIETQRLRTEMMTGEFTGLSVPDVVIVITALFMVSKKDLIGLLDANSIAEMRKDPILNSALDSLGIGSPDADVDTVKTALENLEKLVDQLYTFLNSEILKIKYKPSRNRKVSPRRDKKR